MTSDQDGGHIKQGQDMMVGQAIYTRWQSDFLGDVHTIGIGVSDNSSIFISLKNFHNDSHKGGTNFHFFQQL